MQTEPMPFMQNEQAHVPGGMLADGDTTLISKAPDTLDVYAEIRSFVASYKNAHHTQTSWREPIIGVAAADDPLFPTLKTLICTTHALPSDLVPGAKSVIAFFIPFAEDIAKSNVRGEFSSTEWMAAYTDTNALITDLTQHLHDKLVEAGFRTSNLPPTYNYDEVNLCSDWSHRSAAYIAGVGTFGVNNMLITPAGCCGRIGSIVTELELPPTPMLEEELCLFKRKGTCGACIRRCVVGSFTIDDGNVGFDARSCNSQIYGKAYPNRQQPGGDSCGKCMVGVPCSTKAPA